jgi:hypothetical protein
LDSNQRRRTPADLQSAPFSHSGTPPRREAGTKAKPPLLSTRTFSPLSAAKAGNWMRSAGAVGPRPYGSTMAAGANLSTSTAPALDPTQVSPHLSSQQKPPGTDAHPLQPAGDPRDEHPPSPQAPHLATNSPRPVHRRRPRRHGHVPTRFPGRRGYLRHRPRHRPTNPGDVVRRPRRRPDHPGHAIGPFRPPHPADGGFHRLHPQHHPPPAW